MAVRIRLKRMGRRHRPYYRICAMDSRAPRDGKVIEELGTYDPMVRDTDARVTLKRERVDYWVGVGAQPTPKVGVLIRKYGTDGTHLEANAAALAKLEEDRKTRVPVIVAPKIPEKAPEPEAPAEEAAATEEAPAVEAATEAPAEEAAAEEATAEAPAEEAGGEEATEEKSE